MEKKPNVVTDIDESLLQLTGSDKPETVIKNLLDIKKLPFITELTFEQIVEICKLKHLATKYGKANFPKLNEKYPIEDSINTFISNFSLYMTSHKRKRVLEFLDGMKSEKEYATKDSGFFKKLLNK